MRLFIAAPLNEAQRSRVEGLLAPLKDSLSREAIRWMPREKWHLTLAFLGEVEEEALPSVVESADLALASHLPFALVPEKIAGFPNPDQPRYVAFCLFSQDGFSGAIYRDLNAALSILEPNRVFRPHATLGKFRDKSHPPATLFVQEEAWLFDTVTLYLSEPGEEGSRHTPLHTWDLANFAGRT